MIPKVDVILENEDIKKLIKEHGHDTVTDLIREELDITREAISHCENEQEAQKITDELIPSIIARANRFYSCSIRPVINGTGTILHTNLGRAPISLKHAEKLTDIVTGYSNLEYNLKAGERGERYAHFEKLLTRITGAEAAIAVNNNAAAVLLILSTMAGDKEAIVSRGELVEVGGRFRIPDVMEQSRAVLREVGTTNKTHLSDYENAITENTAVIMKVHTSNYRIVGFTEDVERKELAELSEKHGLPFIEDLGSGVLVDLSKYGLTYEPTVQDSIKAGVDVVCFSGDKLLGGPQAGIIVGKRKYIDRMKKNQLMRAIRIDKFTAAVLEFVLRDYLNEEMAAKEIPVLRMLSESAENVKSRAEFLSQMMEMVKLQAEISLEPCESQVGGGSLPLERIPGTAVALKPFNMTTSSLEEKMRGFDVPIIGRVVNDHILLDVRTIEKKDFPVICNELKEILA